MEALERIITLVTTQAWSAPLPKPGDLVAYNQAQPDASERIIKMAEREQGVVRLEMWLSFVVMGLAVAASVWGLYLGNTPWVVGTPATVGVAITGYVWARRSHRRHPH